MLGERWAWGHRVSVCMRKWVQAAGLTVLRKQVSGKKRLLEPRAAL